VAHIANSIEVNVPVRQAYNQWTQFEEFPRFMEGVKEVRQIDDQRLHWRAEVGGKEVEWTAEINEQVPDKQISWRSTSGAPNSGTVRFEPVGANRTKVTLLVNYEPEGAMQKTGSAIGVVESRVQGDLERFRDFIEKRGTETGAWRGEIRGSAVRKPDEHGMGAPGSL
jgi:uncharacterized membrane protein